MSDLSERQARIEQYARDYRSDYGFEGAMVAARHHLIAGLVADEDPKVVVEVGCGAELLFHAVRSRAPSLRRWVVVEPSAEFAQVAEQAARESDVLVVRRGFLEDAVGDLLAEPGDPVDLVVCSSLLHEVSEPAAILDACHALLAPSRGLLHVNVPNAGSLHRRLARAMGLVRDEHEMSARNRLLDQHHVLGIDDLVPLVSAAGFRPARSGGYFLKPFTHDQMASLEFLTEEMLEGLWILGTELPEMAAEIYVDARAAGGAGNVP